MLTSKRRSSIGALVVALTAWTTRLQADVVQAAPPVLQPRQPESPAADGTMSTRMPGYAVIDSWTQADPFGSREEPRWRPTSASSIPAPR